MLTPHVRVELVVEYVYAFTSVEGQNTKIARLEVTEWLTDDEFRYRYFEAPKWHSSTAIIDNDWYFRTEAEAVAELHKWLNQDISDLDEKIFSLQDEMVSLLAQNRDTLEEFSKTDIRNY